MHTPKNRMTMMVLITMTPEVSPISTMDGVVILVFLLFSLGLLYVFYPALSISKTRSKVTEKVVLEHKSDDAVLLSFVIPAYNEEERLPVMLDAALQSIETYQKRILELAQRKSGLSSTRMEWIIVSDGSTDNTVPVAEMYGRKLANKNDFVWNVVTMHTNSGKGAAVRTGMLVASGALRLMVDADGATDFDALIQLLEHDEPIAFGSRAHLASNAQRSFLRTLLMHGFHGCVNLLVGSTIQDTQCGFKLFTHHAAEVLFGTLHLQRWAFDIELVVLAKRLNLNVAEVGVPWQEVEGSKLDSSKLQLALVAISMLRDMLCVRLCYMLGIWKIQDVIQQGKKLQ